MIVILVDHVDSFQHTQRIYYELSSPSRHSSTNELLSELEVFLLDARKQVVFAKFIEEELEGIEWHAGPAVDQITTH